MHISPLLIPIMALLIPIAWWSRAHWMALQQLSDKQREVLILRYYSDLSEAEIADALGISRGAVKTHAHRGLAHLRTVLGSPAGTRPRLTEEGE